MDSVLKVPMTKVLFRNTDESQEAMSILSKKKGGKAKPDKPKKEKVAMAPGHTYCTKCKKGTKDTKDKPEFVTTSNGRPMKKTICSECKGKKNTFISTADAAKNKSHSSELFTVFSDFS
ncbi:hypothetical protein [Carp edema virus]|nr:hypothetical protein [Carp edema virus]